MAKRKFTFEELREMQKNNNEEFIKNVFENFPSNVFFDGEICLTSSQKDEKEDKDCAQYSSKWIYLSDDERKKLIEMAKEKWEREKQELLEEGERRYERAKNNPLAMKYKNPIIGRIICESLEEGQKIPEWLFIKACKLFDKHKEEDGKLSKSYMFKGFLRWEQIEREMKYKEKSNASEE